MKSLNQKGFAAVETLLVVVILAALLGVGYYVWHANQQTRATLDAASKVAQSGPLKTMKKSSINDSTADWVSYTSKDGSFSLKYPKTWVTATHPDLCSGDILLLGPTEAAVGQCGSEGFGEAAFTFSTSHSCFPLDESYSSKTSTSLVISDIKGTKETGTSKGTDAQGLGGLPLGTKVIQYCFNTTNKHYTAIYNQQPNYPDAEAVFETIVANTLKFQ